MDSVCGLTAWSQATQRVAETGLQPPAADSMRRSRDTSCRISAAPFLLVPLFPIPAMARYRPSGRDMPQPESGLLQRAPAPHRHRRRRSHRRTSPVFDVDTIASADSGRRFERLERCGRADNPECGCCAATRRRWKRWRTFSWRCLSWTLTPRC